LAYPLQNAKKMQRGGLDGAKGFYSLSFICCFVRPVYLVI
jgi:hypothetical protein